MTANIFEGISPSIRKTFYYVYGLLGIVIGATQVGYSAAELGQPVWLTVSLAVFAFVGTAFGVTAGANTPKIVFEDEDELEEKLGE